MAVVTEGTLAPGLPYVRLGTGPPLLMTASLRPDHEPPTGWGRRMVTGGLGPFAEHHTVYVVGRLPGLAAGSSMADIAGHYAEAIEHDLGGGPVAVHGTSTGGSVALQLAVDHPHLVRRLVLVASACRLSDHGRALMAEVARLAREEGVAAAWAEMGTTISPPLAAPAVRWLTRVAGRSLHRMDPADLLATIAAEDAFDVEGRLPDVTAPTLVIGGSRDPFYSEDLFRRTADGIPGGRAVVFRGKGHGYASASATSRNLALGFLLG